MAEPIIIEPLTRSSDARVFQALAEIHKQEIVDGFLSSLGEPFLRQLYRALVSSDDAFLLAATQGEKVHGFICCSTNTRGAYRHVLAKHWFRLVSILVPRLLSPKRIWRILETLAYPFVKKAGQGRPVENLPDEDWKAEILNFCVSRDSQRLGIGRRLFSAAVDEYRRHNVSDIHFVTGQNQDKAQSFYDSLGAQRLANVQVHAGTTSVAYRYAIPLATQTKNTAA